METWQKVTIGVACVIGAIIIFKQLRRPSVVSTATPPPVVPHPGQPLVPVPAVVANPTSCQSLDSQLNALRALLPNTDCTTGGAIVTHMNAVIGALQANGCTPPGVGVKPYTQYSMPCQPE